MNKKLRQHIPILSYAILMEQDKKVILQGFDHQEIDFIVKGINEYLGAMGVTDKVTLSKHRLSFKGNARIYIKEITSNCGLKFSGAIFDDKIKL